MSKLFNFQEILGYEFDDKNLLEDALTHSSIIRKKNEDGSIRRGFDRLEFLGDRVLNLLIAQWLYQIFDQESEGDLAHRYTMLVRFETCALIAHEIQLPSFLKAATNTDLEDQRILCDAVEAVLGAMFLDGGLAPCRKFVRKFWLKFIQESPNPPSDPKSDLQEFVQSRWKILPTYEIVSKTGLEHQPIFQVSANVAGIGTAVGFGPSKKVAQKEAAQKLLNKLKAKC